MPADLEDLERLAREARGITVSVSGGSLKGTVTNVSMPTRSARAAINAYMAAAQPSTILALLEERKRLLKEAERLADIRKIVGEWFEPWGAWKTEWWEDLSDDQPWSSDTMLEIIHNKLAALEGEKP